MSDTEPALASVRAKSGEILTARRTSKVDRVLVWQSLKRHKPFAAQVQRALAGEQDGEPGAAARQRCQLRPRVHEAFHPIEDEHQPLLSHPDDQPFHGRDAGGRSAAHHLRDQFDGKCRVLQCGQVKSAHVEPGQA
jgi:hypothetical protein